ncbi:MAG: tautomerase family protein [Gammaproteobacteria bacterium]|nr:tautomerase family protein [Gammaproteobacteria bacterium]
MPLVTISISEGFSLGDKRIVADCVHDALVGVGFPETDRFQKILRLSRDQFIYDRHHPDLEEPRSNRFVLIEIVMPEGRSREFKKDLLMIIAENLRERIGVRAKDVMVLFMETDRENWAYDCGVQYYSARSDRGISNMSKKDLRTDAFIVDFQDRIGPITRQRE